MENKKVIAMYIRLSDEDRNVDGYDKTESNSILSQHNLITSYIRENSEFSDYEICEYADVYNQRLIPFDTKKAVQTPKITAFEGKSTCRKPFFHSLKLYCSVAGFINAPSK